MSRANVRPAPGVRQIVIVVAVAFAVLTAGVSGSLVVLTTSMHDTSKVLRETVHGARLAREAQVDLLRHERSPDPVERAGLERKLRQTLADDFGYEATSAATRAVHEDAKGKVERYLGAAPDENSFSVATPSALEAALDALELVVVATAARADEALARASRLDRLGDVTGVAAMVLMVGLLVLVVVGARSFIVRPMLALSDAMGRFGSGDLTVRATPSGAAELRGMTQQFNAMGETLARQQKARLTHLAGVAHDLRNPLSALQMSAALVDPEQPLPPEPSLRRALALVRRQVLRLNRMVEDLLDVARIDAGHLALELRQTDLRDVVHEVAALFKDVSELHALYVEVPEEPIVLRCDPLRIEQTLSNLVSNAIKYSPRGGAVRIRAYREEGLAKVSVSDEGVGIRASDLDEIWAPFRRTGVSSEAIPGVGLGLWTAKQIADAHHGKLLVDSAIAEGSTFTLVLPLSDGAAEGKQVSGQEAASSSMGMPSARRAGSHG